MRSITYRQKLRLKKALKILIWTVTALAAAVVLFVLFVGRYVVYTDHGAYIDYHRSAAVSTQEGGTEATYEPISVTIDYEDTAVPVSHSSTLRGYYITTKQLRQTQNLREAVAGLPSGTPVMLELKSVFGYYYYHTKISGAQTAEADIDAVETLIRLLKDKGCPLIARIHAYSDYAFAQAHPSCGLPLANGALWTDETNCYWLDPANETVSTYLIQIAKELSGRGFQEVVFDSFRFPDSSRIVYSEDPSAVIQAAGEKIASYFESSNLRISFVTDAGDFPFFSPQSALYLTAGNRAQFEALQEQYAQTEYAKSQLVWLAAEEDANPQDENILLPIKEGE